MKKNINNWGDLKEFVNQLTDVQLLKPVRVWGEGFNYGVEQAEVIDEDHINPSGDGCEPVSVYTNDPEYADILDYEPIVVHAGEIYLSAQ